MTDAARKKGGRVMGARDEHWATPPLNFGKPAVGPEPNGPDDGKRAVPVGGKRGDEGGGRALGHDTLEPPGKQPSDPSLTGHATRSWPWRGPSAGG
jgi:hypothetical protein